jgi:uncharacterized protein (DUF4415 family)
MPKPSKNKGYTKADLHAVSDNPTWTKDDFAKAKSFDQAFPALARRRGKQKAPTKKAISMRIDADILDAYKATGTGWQSRINSDLRRVMKLG